MTEGATQTRSVRRIWLILGMITAVVVVAGAFTWVGSRALLARQQLDSLVPLATELKSALESRDLTQLSTVSTQLGADAERAAELTSDPLWGGAEAVPVLGPNLRAARVASTELNALVNDVLHPMLISAAKLKGSTAHAVDLTALHDAAPTLTAAETAVTRAQHELDAVETRDILAPLAHGIRELRSAANLIAPVVHALAGFARLAPQILGLDGPRTILVIIQNNAELRTGGGISGEMVQLTADKGHITFGSVADSSQFPTLLTPIVPIPASTSALYGNVVGRFVENSTMTSDFSLTGRLASAWWAKTKGVTPDVVLAIDPAVLQAILKVSGPVVVDGATLTSQNVLQRLLVDTYRTLTDAPAQDAFFAAAAEAVFARVAAGDVDFLKLVGALQTPLQQGRISAWSAHPDEEGVLSAGALGGPAVRQRLAGSNAFAVYLNDATAGKMDGYLKTTITSGTAVCRADGRSTMAISVTLHSTAPADAATALPARVTGGNLVGVPMGDIASSVSVAAPAGSYFGGVRVDGQSVPSTSRVDVGVPVTVTRVTLTPGQRKTATFTFFSVGLAKVTPVILHTPMINAPNRVTARPSCG
jgi:hypothetical protein